MLNREKKAAVLGAQEPLELLNIQPVAADHSAIEEQDGYVQAVAADQFGVSIDIHYGNGRKRPLPTQGLQLGHHLVTQIAVLTMDHRESGVRIQAKRSVPWNADRRTL